ncbi:MAG TPA: beta-ketoacyl-[acyl-carrier-protein] synthase family protein [Bryobacteraceae bacterium]|nr:beta-ketoacyl-[acyl-carrier-protein] synthase family protein [Bryobacteraceae bacterium]
MHRVVITGMGMSTSLGPDLRTCWQRLLAGDSGIAPLSFWDPSEYHTKVVAEVKHVPRETGSDAIPPDWCRRGVRLFLPVVREALADAQLDRSSGAPDPAPEQIGIAVGTSVNYLDMYLMKHYFQLRKPDSPELDMARFAREGRQPDNSFYRRLGDMIASVPAKLLKLAGPAFVMDTACAASSHAIGEAFRLVRLGRVRAMVAGGAAALVSPLPILAFSLLGALSRNANPELASRPFDRQRDGFVMGEGGGAVVLETLESAQARGARIYAELAGYGSSLNAYTLTDPSPDGSAEARAIGIALQQAELAPEDVDYIAAHGTSTPKNDPIETAAIKRAFGAHAARLMVSSNKGQIGHTISAAGVCNLICAVKAITEGQVPPTMHLRSPDPQCDLDYVPNQSRAARVRAALANAFAFGGQNAVLAVRAVAG